MTNLLIVALTLDLTRAEREAFNLHRRKHHENNATEALG